MKHAVLLQAFDRRDPLAFLHRRKRHTRQDTPAIDVHGACAALSAIACLFGAGECQIIAQRIEERGTRLDGHRAGLTIDRQIHAHDLDARLSAATAAARLIVRSAAELWRLAHFALATSAALIPSNASPSVTPSSMMRRSFWVIAMRVYFVVSDGSLASPSAISRARGSSLSAGTISLTAPQSFAVRASSSWRVMIK